MRAASRPGKVEASAIRLTASSQEEIRTPAILNAAMQIATWKVSPSAIENQSYSPRSTTAGRPVRGALPNPHERSRSRTIIHMDQAASMFSLDLGKWRNDEDPGG